MGGLKLEIVNGIRMFRPRTLKDVIRLAYVREEQVSRQYRLNRTGRVQPVSSLPEQASRVLVSSNVALKCLSWEEMQHLRIHGLCFNCDEQFTVGHRCRKPQLLLLEGGQSKDEEIEVGESEISLYAFTGWATARILRVEAIIRQQLIIALIDSRFTHNFINEKVVSKLRLPVMPTKYFSVKIAYGSPMRCQRRFNGVLMHIQGIFFSLTLFFLPLTGLDVVLRMQWLESLGLIVCNWKNLIMAFHWNS